MSLDWQSRPDFSKDRSYGKAYSRAHSSVFASLLLAGLVALFVTFVVPIPIALALSYAGFFLVAACSYRFGSRLALVVGSIVVAVDVALLSPDIQVSSALQGAIFAIAVAFVALAFAFQGVGKIAAEFNQIRFSTQFKCLASREVFVMLLDKELARAKRHSQPASLVLAELSILDQIEKAHGRHQSDLLSRQYQLAFANHLRRSDTFAWLGGPFLAILLPGTRTDGAKVAVDRLRETAPDVPVRITRGAATVSSDWHVAVAELDGNADDPYCALIGLAEQLGPSAVRRLQLLLRR